MIHVQRINSLATPELAPYQTMRRQIDQREQGIFVAESDKVVHRLLESGLEVVSLLLPEKWLGHFEPLLAKRAEDIRVYLLEKKELERLTGFTFYQGVLAVGKVPRQPGLEELLNRDLGQALFAAVEGVTNAENLGGMIRSLAAFGGEALLLDRASCSPFLRRAVRSSMGTIFRMPALEKLDLVGTIRILRNRGIRCVAAHPHTPGHWLTNVDLKGPCCLVFGSEGYGISSGVLEACDEAVAIPMSSGVDSLNVGNAAAVFLYEVHRQRTSPGPACS